MTKIFTKKQITAVANLTPRQVQFYTEQKIISPSVSDTIYKGRGKPRLYSEKDLIYFCILKQLIEWGITIRIISRIMFNIETLKIKSAGKITYIYIYINKEENFLVTTKIEKLEKYDSFLSINLTKIFTRLRKFIK